MTRDEEEAAMAAFLSDRKPTRLRKGVANAPPITKIRRAVSAGKPLVVRRSFGRDIVYNPASVTTDSQPPREHPGAGARGRRRRVWRSANKRPAQN